MIVYVLEFGNQRIEFATLELANQYAINNKIDAIPFEYEKVVEEVKIEVVEELPEAPKEIIDFINDLKTKYKIE